MNAPHALLALLLFTAQSESALAQVWFPGSGSDAIDCQPASRCHQSDIIEKCNGRDRDGVLLVKCRAAAAAELESAPTQQQHITFASQPVTFPTQPKAEYLPRYQPTTTSTTITTAQAQRANSECACTAVRACPALEAVVAHKRFSDLERVPRCGFVDGEPGYCCPDEPVQHGHEHEHVESPFIIAMTSTRASTTTATTSIRTTASSTTTTATTTPKAADASLSNFIQENMRKGALHRDSLEADLSEVEWLCGVRADRFPRRVGRSVDYASEESFPWMVALGYGRTEDEDMPWRRQYLCAGALIGHRHVLTAAHCADGVASLRLLDVRMGSHNLDSARSFSVKIESFHSHPLYDSVGLKHDVAIITLARHVEFTDDVSPACLPAGRDQPVPADLTVPGWDLGVSGSSGRILREMHMRTQPIAECVDKYRGFMTIDEDTMVCAAKSGGHCFSDAGGPVLAEDEVHSQGRYVVVGVTALGTRRCDHDVPGVFNKVADSIDWIKQVMATT